jgi:hypothetical protein
VFSPYKSVTRAQSVAFLYRLKGFPVNVANTFSDLYQGKYYYDAVLWAVDNGITKGTAKGKFSPNEPCLRNQIVTFLYRTADMPETDISLASTSTPTPSTTPVSVTNTNPFKDVPEGKYYYDAVLWAVDKGITSGTSDTAFSPKKECTRAEMVTFLWRVSGSPEPMTTVNPFNDVSEHAYFYKAVLWAVENGITNGTSPGVFSPYKSVTRAQSVAFLYRLKGTPVNGTNTFSDLYESKYYYNAVLWAVENDITKGTAKGKFSPNEPCLRNQIVTFLYRSFN